MMISVVNGLGVMIVSTLPFCSRSQKSSTTSSASNNPAVISGTPAASPASPAPRASPASTVPASSESRDFGWRSEYEIPCNTFEEVMVQKYKQKEREKPLEEKKMNEKAIEAEEKRLEQLDNKTVGDFTQDFNEWKNKKGEEKSGGK